MRDQSFSARYVVFAETFWPAFGETPYMRALYECKVSC